MFTLSRPLANFVPLLRHEATVVRGTLACLFELGLMTTLALAHLFFPVDGIINILFYFVVVLLIGSRMRSLGNIVHECAHNSFTTHRSFNHMCGQLLCIFDFRSFSKYKREHMAHHRFLGDKNLDPDYLGYDFKLRCYLKNFLPTFYRQSDSIWVNVLRLSWLAVLVGLVWYPNTRNATLAYYFIPYLTSYMALRVYSDFSDHWGLTHHQNRTLRSRNHTLKFYFLNVIFLPRNDGFHLLHHLFPNVPTWCYKAVHHDLMTNNPEYRRLHVED